MAAYADSWLDMCGTSPGPYYRDRDQNMKPSQDRNNNVQLFNTQYLIAFQRKFFTRPKSNYFFHI